MMLDARAANPAGPSVVWHCSANEICLFLFFSFFFWGGGGVARVAFSISHSRPEVTLCG